MNIWEQQDEKETARAWKRPIKHYIYDLPFYPECVPEPIVNFDLNFKQ